MLEERWRAYEALLAFEKNGSFLRESELSPFAFSLAFGVCRRKLHLDYIIGKHVKKMPALPAKILLQMGIFQLFWMDVPDYSSISTSVELAKTLKLGKGIPNLINAVLRSVQRSGLPELPNKKLLRASIEYSVPLPLMRHWFSTLGVTEACSFSYKHLSLPSNFLRVNLNKTSPENLAERLGISAKVYNARFLELPSNFSLREVLRSEAFFRGEFSVQNPAAFEVVSLLRLSKGLKVWDVCAAPGGKTGLMMELENDLDILATDISESRLKSLDDLKTRLGFKNIQTAVLDAAKEIPQEHFDRILLDVPCSNLGVIDRRPEAVYRATPETLKDHATLQLKILENASLSLLPGGILVYATCSQEKMETTEVIQKFLERAPNFSTLGEPCFSGRNDEKIDRFFAQALMKREEKEEK